MLKKIPAFLLILILSTLYSPQSLSSNEEQISARLVIIGPGSLLYLYWGHIGLAIYDENTGRDSFYDFGNFSFHSDNFFLDFLQGLMPYLAIESPMNEILARYRINNRTITEYPLNLGKEELKRMDSILKNWVKPENRIYQYDYFLNNCSTIIRDILNEATYGSLRIPTEDVPDKTFRHYTRTGTSSSFFADILLHYLLGPTFDKTISRWDLMFLPQAVADIAQNITYTDSNGTPRILLGKGNVIEPSTRPPTPKKPLTLWPTLLLIGIIFAILWILPFYLQKKGLHSLFIISGKIIQFFIIFLVGFPGVVLGYLMLFTNHDGVNWNVNIFPSFPTILLGFFVLFAPHQWNPQRILRWLWTINFAGLILSFILVTTGIIHQQAGAFWALYAPLLLVASHPGYVWYKKIKEKLNW